MPKRIAAFLVILCLFSAFPACSRPAKDIPTRVCFSGRCFQVEIARTDEERARGLQARRSLGSGEGMLFIFPRSEHHSFWMKDTYIPLDIIWIDQNRKVATVIPNILPCETKQCPVYTSDRKAMYVLEVNAGKTTELGIKTGDQAEFK